VEDLYVEADVFLQDRQQQDDDVRIISKNNGNIIILWSEGKPVDVQYCVTVEV